MSKILFVTQRLTTNSLNQIEIIKRSGHEFTIVTSQSEKISNLAHSDILYFFSKWNLIELVKFLPSFMIINPDIVHVFVDSKASVRTADFFAALSQIFNKIFSLQFFLSEDSFLKIPKAKKLVYLADVVTGPHRTFLYHLRGMHAKNKYQIKGVIPPVLHLSDKSAAPLPASSIKNEFLNYNLLVPLKRDGYDEAVIVALAKRFPLVLALEKESWSAADIKKLNHVLSQNNCCPWRIWPLETLKNLKLVPDSKLSFWMAGLDFELDECIRFFEFTLNRKMRIVMDQTQSRFYPDLWENNPMASIANKLDIQNYISQFKLNTESGDNWMEHLNTASLVDVSVNEFNRLISKATNTQNEKTI